MSISIPIPSSLMDSEHGDIVPTALSVVVVVTSENVVSDPVAEAINKLSSQVSTQIEAINTKMGRLAEQISMVELGGDSARESLAEQASTVKNRPLDWADVAQRIAILHSELSLTELLFLALFGLHRYMLCVKLSFVDSATLAEKNHRGQMGETEVLNQDTC